MWWYFNSSCCFKVKTKKPLYLVTYLFCFCFTYGNFAIFRIACNSFLLGSYSDVQIYTLVQTQTPPQLVGKIMATLVAVAMCGQPIGQMVYGILFDVFIQETWVVMFVASIASIMISIYSKRIFQKLEI